MTEFKIQVEDSVIQAIGIKAIEEQLQKLVELLQFRAAVPELLADLEEIDHSKDEHWEAAKQASNEAARIWHNNFLHEQTIAVK